ncbi:hypothetical protein FE257_006334 [Aspergillus nanangensis]|uniref:DUF6536 domain-containing protein n=1 Tax=Aspergillus nanangensis TaxID=2582783 RepID=A0AAD4GW56_ASPNN|nr:hypothetical protein FE257_006334 [Aspergillus nanangensis]
MKLAGDKATQYAEDIHPHIAEEQNDRRSFKARFAGWRGSLLLGCVTSVVVLCLNLGFAGWAAQHHHLHDNQGTLYEGDCTIVRNAGIGFHLVINILSTALLSASNYCMVSKDVPPSREDVDIAHQKGQWLDIGISSFRNLRMVSRKQAWLWTGLALSSVPLHLIYNSTVFLSISANAYDVFAGNGALNQTTTASIQRDFGGESRQSFLRLHEKASNGTLYRLDNSACVDAYATAYQSQHGSVVVVTDDITPADHYSLAYTETVFNPANQAVVGASGFNWLCQDLQHHEYTWQITPCITFLPNVRAQVAANNWTVGGHKVDYCLAEEVAPHCKLQYSLPLILIVIAFNLVKAIILCYSAFAWTETPILTTGDAIASFLRTPDRFSTGTSRLTMHAVRFPAKYAATAPFDATPQRWRAALSRKRWVTGITSYSFALFICVLLLTFGLTLSFDSTGIWGVGLGQVSTQSLISSGGNWYPSIIANSILANLPQLIFSMLYFAFNGIVTTMALADEWSQFATERKGLRVSSPPTGAQRSRYFLSLPYRYAIPFIVLSMVIHWLISESLFLAVIEAFTVNLERDPKMDITTCGYSPVAIVATIAVGIIVLGSLISLTFRRFKSGMPVAGSCSLAIAAACHPPTSRVGWPESDDAASLPLQWGLLVNDGAGARHCAFSSAEVTMPSHGWVS